MRPEGLRELFYTVMHICAVICAQVSGLGLRELLYLVLHIFAVISALVYGWGLALCCAAHHS